MKKDLFLPVALMLVFALSRIPGCLPENFSAAYALMFCAGVYFPGRLAWWLLLTVMVVSDMGLNLYYQADMGIPTFDVGLIKYLAINYVAYAGLIWLGRRFKSSDRLLTLLTGGIVGAILFYLLTNTASWLFNPFHNPEYTRNWAGWLTALTRGTAGYPPTWEFFRNTMISGGLFTGLFVGAVKLAEPKSEQEEAEAETEESEEGHEAST
jgi:hypothetical protein